MTSHQWKAPVSTTKEIKRLTEVWKTTEHLFRKEIARLQNIDRVFMASEESYMKFDKTTFIADTGASTHMVNSDDGMFDCKDIMEPIVLCNGKKMMATKIGKIRMTAIQVDGSTADVVLQGVKFVPGLDMNLFSVMRSLDQGWNISNDKTHMMLSKNKITLKFDREYPTKNGRLVGINLVTRTRSNTGELAMQAMEEGANDDTKPTKTWNINRMHQVYNHANEEKLRRTAKIYGWKITGKMEPCMECQMSNIKQKAVAKYTDTKSEIAGERIFIDTSSIKAKTLGGSKYVLGIVDDASNYTWGSMLKKKSD